MVLSVLAACQDYEFARSRVLDSFEQTGRSGAVDVLWVLDDSGSMYEERVALAEHGGAFVSVLATSSLDFRIGVVSTDMDREDAGLLLGPLLTQDTDGLSTAFAELIVTETDGSRTEQGLAAAAAALAGDGPNPELASGNVDLEIIVYTDEDDASEGEVGEWVEQLESVRVGHSVHLHAIAGDLPEGCFSLDAAADAGVRYIDTARAMGGVAESICAADTEAMLTRVAHASLGLQTSFPLTNLPVLSSLEVRVDGALVWQRDVDGWRYDAVENAIVFDGWAVPQAGQGIAVDYWDWAEGAPREE